MEAGLISSIATVVLFLVFIGIVWWAYHKGNRQRFEEAARLPFEEDADEYDEGRSILKQNPRRMQ